MNKKHSELDFSKPVDVAKAINMLWDQLLKIANNADCFGGYERKICTDCDLRFECKKIRKRVEINLE